MRQALGNLLLLLISVAVASSAAEVVSRLVMPIRATPIWDVQGRAIDIHDGPFRLLSNVKVRQATSEFDVVYTLTASGNRFPEPHGNPGMVFLGDSFTFGTGVNDEETFVYRYCHDAAIECANLGRMGTGTKRQIDVLEYYLRTEGWRPRRVRLMMFAMTGALMNGNDLTDNLEEEQGTTDTDRFVAKGERLSLTRYLVKWRYVFLERSNLARIAMLYAGPAIRARLSPSADKALVARALDATGRELDRLKALGTEYGFSADVEVIHPMQDLVRGTWPDTLEAVKHVAPEGLPVRSTAPAFRDDPASYYFSFDMHLNPRGHQAVAEALRDAG